MAFNPQFQKVGDILVYQNVITNDELEKALSEQKESNEKLGQILINQGVITETQLVHAYSQQMGHKHILENDLLILSIEDVGLLSEAGLPCIADPGSKIVEYAHDFQIEVVPLVGPSSILLALMASGMSGQNFAFTGYLPIDKKERIKTIKQLELLAKKTGQTQIFMETPYRNHQLLDILKAKCNNKTKLCIAANITSINEFIQTKTIEEWKQTKVDIHKQPAIFLIS